MLRAKPIRQTLLACLIGGLLLAGALPGVAPARAAVVGPGPQPVVSGAAVAVTIGESGYNAFPEGIILPNGTIRVYYTHGSEHGGAASGLMRSSFDSGQTWSAPREVGTIRSPIRLSDGTIVAASTARVGANGTDSRRPASTRSRDGGYSWTTDGLAAGGAGFGGEAMPFSLVKLKDGSLLMSVSGKEHATDTQRIVRYLRSTDKGRTWTVRATIKQAGQSLTEPSLAVASNGLIVSAMRVDDEKGVDGTIHFTESRDSGATWTPIRPVLKHASGFPRLAFLPDGSLVAMYRSTWTDFMPFRYARSVDQGVTWTFGLDFTKGSLRKMMAGAWLISGSKSKVGVIYGLENDWYHATVYYRTLKLPSAGIEVRGMTRTIVHKGSGTYVRVKGRVVSVNAKGVERRLSGIRVKFTLRSYDPKDGVSITTKQLVKKSNSKGMIKALVRIPRHGELRMKVKGMSGMYRVGTYRSRPGFSKCPATQTATSGKTYYLWCQAKPVAGFGAEFQRWDGGQWVHQKSDWADSTGLFKTPVRVTSNTQYRLTIWQTKWTDRVWSRVITVVPG